MKRLLDAQDDGRCPCAAARRPLGQRLGHLDAHIAVLARQREDVDVVLAEIPPLQTKRAAS